MLDIGRRGFCASLAAAFSLAAAKRAGGEQDGYPAIVGATRAYTTRYSDSLVDLARASGLGYTEIVAANPGVDPWVPGAGVELVLPTGHVLPDAPREGLVLNLADQRLYFFRPDNRTVDTAPLGIGNEGWDTPTGATKIVRKQRNPTWYVPKSVQEEQPELPAIVRPGPDNPLGKHALYLGWPAYLIHGTNKPYGVGRRVSHGCVRLYPEDISRLYDDVQIGMPVRVVDQDVKLARRDSQLWLEVHPNQKQADEIERTGTFAPRRPAELEFKVIRAAESDRDRIDWAAVGKAARERRGVPVPVLSRATSPG